MCQESPSGAQSAGSGSVWIKQYFRYFPSGGNVANHGRKSCKRPVVVRDTPLPVGQAIDLGAVPKRNQLQLPVCARQVILQVVGQDGDVTCVIHDDLRIELLATDN